MKILGILNITTDSFSDGGKYLAPEAALAHADGCWRRRGHHRYRRGVLPSRCRAGAARIEIARLASVIPALHDMGASLSIDSFAPQVQRWALAQGVDYLNDIHGFAEPALYPTLAAASAKLIVMHTVQSDGIATRVDVPPEEIFDRILAFFDAAAGGADRGRHRPRAADPGPRHGLFPRHQPADLADRAGPPAGAGRAPSACRLLVWVSRKSFLEGAGRRPAGAEEASAGRRNVRGCPGRGLYPHPCARRRCGTA